MLYDYFYLVAVVAFSVQTFYHHFHCTLPLKRLSKRQSHFHHMMNQHTIFNAYSPSESQKYVLELSLTRQLRAWRKEWQC